MKTQPRDREVVAIPASEVRRERVEWLEAGRVPLGMVTVLAGVGGLGKSTWTCLLASRNPGVTLIATAEDSPEATVRPRLEAVDADLERVRFVSVRTGDGLEDGITIPDDIGDLERVVAETKATLVVVDPLVAHLPSHIDSHKDQSVRRALAPLYRLAKEYRCAVVAVIHLNKGLGFSPLMRLGGSGGFGNAARSVLLLDRDPDDPDGEDGRRRVLAHIKCNVAEEAPPSLLYEIAPILLPAQGGEPEVETSRLEELGESAHNGRSILAGVAEDDEERSSLAEARDFLRDALADGRRLVKDVDREARQLGISPRTLKRARKGLVQALHPDVPGPWFLELVGGHVSWPSSGPNGDGSLGGNRVTMRDSGSSERVESAKGVSSRGRVPLTLLDDAEVRRLITSYRPELLGRDDLITAGECRQVAVLLNLYERAGLLEEPVAA